MSRSGAHGSIVGYSLRRADGSRSGTKTTRNATITKKTHRCFVVFVNFVVFVPERQPSARLSQRRLTFVVDRCRSSELASSTSRANSAR
jgi:hypothetical protein